MINRLAFIARVRERFPEATIHREGPHPTQRGLYQIRVLLAPTDARVFVTTGDCDASLDPSEWEDAAEFDEEFADGDFLASFLDDDEFEGTWVGKNRALWR